MTQGREPDTPNVRGHHTHSEPLPGPARAPAPAPALAPEMHTNRRWMRSWLPWNRDRTFSLAAAGASGAGSSASALHGGKRGSWGEASGPRPPRLVPRRPSLRSVVLTSACGGSPHLLAASQWAGGCAP